MCKKYKTKNIVRIKHIRIYTSVFSAKQYCVCLYLFGTVVAEKTTHVNLGREIKVTLVKAHKCIMFTYLYSVFSSIYVYT